MSVKTTGEEWLRFYNDPKVWGESGWHEDEYLTANGVEVGSYDDIRPIDTMTLSGGVFYPNAGAKESYSLESVFRKWRREQSFTSLVVEVKNEDVVKLKEVAKEHGWKVK